MNKKLFSWKALAGVALLAAVSFTSCNSDTPIDSSNPSGVAPTAAFKAPSVLADGTGDLNLAITKSADVDALWNDASQVTPAMKAAFAKLNEMTVVIDCREFKLDGGPMNLPNFFNADPKGKVLNLIFINEFKETKAALDISADNLKDALLNVVVPAQAFDMTVDFDQVRSTIASEGDATIKTLIGTTAEGTKSALVVKDGVTINAIKIAATGDVIENGGEIKAVYANANVTADPKGFQVGKNGLTYVSDLIVDANITVDGKKVNNAKAVIGTISVNEAKTLTVTEANIASIEAIVGLGDMTKAAKQSHLADVAATASLIKNIVIDADPATVKKDVFENVQFAGDVTLSAESIEGVTFGKNVKVNFTADDKTFTFKGITFNNKINVTGAVEIGTGIDKKTYQWIVDHYELVGADGKVNKDNEGYTAVEYASKDVIVTATTATTFTITDAKGNEIKDHIITVLNPTAGVNLAPKNAVVVLDENCKIGTKAVTSASVLELTDLFPQPVAATSEEYPEKPWYNVQVGDKLYTWTKAASSDAPAHYYYLVAAE